MLRKITKSSFQLISLLAISGSFILLGFGTLYLSNDVDAQAGQDCKDVQIIFARGSGSGFNADEAKKFFGQLKVRINSPATANFYELGQGWPGHMNSTELYPAVNITNGWNGNAVGAELAGGMGNDYGDSVQKGVNELRNYILSLSSQCPNTKIVLGGYSQGAQVIGQALASLDSDSLARNIVFVALFGDPKLNLPEGRGETPDACYGRNLSPWRRIVPSCGTNEGSLGARSPYVPNRYAQKVGTWCNDNDFICGSSDSPHYTSGHGLYAKEGGAIDDAAREIASRLKQSLGAVGAAAIDDSKYVGNDVEGIGPDIAFVINENFLSNNGITEVMRQNIIAQARNIMAMNGKAAIVEYYAQPSGHGWFGPGFLMGNTPTKGLIGYSNADLFTSRLYYMDSFAIPFSGDAAGVGYDAIIRAYDEMTWTQGADKSLVFISDTLSKQQYQYHPDTNGIWYQVNEYIVRRSQEIDPVVMYPIVGVQEGQQIPQSIQQAADATGGKVFVSDPADQNGLVAALAGVTETIATRPSVQFSLPQYYYNDQRSVTFDVAQTHSTAPIVNYKWDYDGDGVWDEQTATPSVVHNYAADYTGLVLAAATDVNGKTGTMTTRIGPMPDVSDDGHLDPPTNITYEIINTTSNKSTINLTWTPKPGAYQYAISINGPQLGVLDGTRHSLEISDIDRSQNTSVDLQTFDEQGNLGERSGIIVPALAQPAALNVNDNITAGSIREVNSPEKSTATSDGEAGLVSGSTNSRVGYLVQNLRVVTTNKWSVVIRGVIIAIIIAAAFLWTRRRAIQSKT